MACIELHLSCSSKPSSYLLCRLFVLSGLGARNKRRLKRTSVCVPRWLVMLSLLALCLVSWTIEVSTCGPAIVIAWWWFVTMATAWEFDFGPKGRRQWWWHSFCTDQNGTILLLLWVGVHRWFALRWWIHCRVPRRAKSYGRRPWQDEEWKPNCHQNYVCYCTFLFWHDSRDCSSDVRSVSLWYAYGRWPPAHIMYSLPHII
jgi:hypothetical protein